MSVLTNFQQVAKNTTFYSPSHLETDESRHTECKKHVWKILATLLSSMDDKYLSDKELKLLHYEIREHINYMTMYLKHAEVLLTWIYINDVMNIWKELALEFELYEGIINLEKLDAML